MSWRILLKSSLNIDPLFNANGIITANDADLKILQKLEAQGIEIIIVD